MKLKSILAAIAICVAALSCNKEETPDPIVLDGVYSGTMSLAVQGTDMDPIAIDLTIQNHKDNKATLISPAFTLKAMGMDMAMPEMRIENINVTETEGVCTLSAAPFSLKVEMMGSPMVFESKKGLKGNAENSHLKVSFDFTPGSMPMAIDCSFTGTKK